MGHQADKAERDEFAEKIKADPRNFIAQPVVELSGVNVAYGSGRAGFLRDTIDYEVYRSMMTLNGKYADAADVKFDDSDIQ